MKNSWAVLAAFVAWLAVGSEAVAFLSLQSGTGPDHLALADFGRRNESAAVEDPVDALMWKPVTSDEPRDYNEETQIGGTPLSVEMLFAFLFCFLVASVPAVLAHMLGAEKFTTAHKLESVMLIIWVASVLIVFTHLVEFRSLTGHFTGARPLTIVEAVYFLAQILSTVGYGDITPATTLGQVWVAMNVIIALCLYGSIIMESTSLIGEKVDAAIQANAAADLLEEQSAMEASRGAPLRGWRQKQIRMPELRDNIAYFFIAVTSGVLFYHYWPGENKTWLQAVYMATITLTTVGFGDYVAMTEAGKVFGAFWMLFGVVALAGAIGSVVEYLSCWKALQRQNEGDDHLRFFKLVQDFSHSDPSHNDRGMDQLDFMKFSLILTGALTVKELEHIELRFEMLSGGTGLVQVDAAFKAEAPPKLPPC